MNGSVLSTVALQNRLSVRVFMYIYMTFLLSDKWISNGNIRHYSKISRINSRIYNRIIVCTRFYRNEIPGLFLGDNGYACSCKLLMPFLTRNIHEISYNAAHKTTRNIGEINWYLEAPILLFKRYLMNQTN